MNIYLEAFVDTNFGDNLFVHTVASRYPQHTFHMLKRDGYEESYQRLLQYEKNICLIEAGENKTFLSNMDAMMIVGGDIFGEHTDYGGLLSSVETIKKQGGQVFLLGLSLLESYSPEISYSLKLLFTWADVIVVRETVTCKQIQTIVPKTNVMAATDMAFALDVTDIISEKTEKGVLGISVRKKIPRNTPDAYTQYCESIANTVEYYLKIDETNTVRFLALSKGVFADEAVADDITALCPEQCRARIQCVPFEGDVDGYIREMQRCEKLLCTRFHALVFAILLKKPFVPIVYEEKTKRLLWEIGYHGVCPSYEEQWNVD